MVISDVRDDVQTPGNFEPQTTPLLVWWTERLFPHFDFDEGLIQCSKGECLTTKRKTLGDPNRSLTGFMFYGTDFDAEDLPMPRSKQYHLWSLFHEESPLNNFLFSQDNGISLFNYTATFREESDYPLTTQFIPSIEYFTGRPAVLTKDKNRIKDEQQLASVLYVQSHCSVPSDRDTYVSELSKYIAIDSYGTCLHNRNLPTGLESTENYDSPEFLDFISKYKFHIAFENAICKDYVTEKLFRALHVGSIPIYKGSPQVRPWVPEGSVILADDFESPEKLAKFIAGLDVDDIAYKDYLQFKQDKSIRNRFLEEVIVKREWGVNEHNKKDFFSGFECFVCDRLIEIKEKVEAGNVIEPKIANSSHMGCPEPSPVFREKLSENNDWAEQGWLESYWFANDTARALQIMQERGDTSSKKVHDIALSLRYHQKP